MERWQSGAFVGLGSIFGGILVAVVAGNLIEPVAAVPGFFAGAIATFAAISVRFFA